MAEVRHTDDESLVLAKFDPECGVSASGRAGGLAAAVSSCVRVLHAGLACRSCASVFRVGLARRSPQAQSRGIAAWPVTAARIGSRGGL